MTRLEFNEKLSKGMTEAIQLHADDTFASFGKNCSIDFSDKEVQRTLTALVYNTIIESHHTALALLEECGFLQFDQE